MKLKDLLELKKLEKRDQDKSIIKKIQLKIDLEDTYQNEREARKEGYTLIGGVDEVGRGPLVGPVVAACVILPEDFALDGLTDSKKLSEKKRDYYFEEIKKQAISYGIGIISEKRIDEINIYEATKEAMIEAINNCNPKPDYVLTDAMKLDLEVPVKPIIKGDLRSITISAASVIAKVTRDKMLYELDKKYPMYDFKNNVGYPTKKHLDAIQKYGIIEEHRRSYGPVKDYVEKSVN
ncbi:MAG: ribonuclease HII [Bacilli bacterium]|nr:ribonuclease HII [Bacilli bacterium]MBR3211248.1 ribonuclease HII [Bacilli bacterium]